MCIVTYREQYDREQALDDIKTSKTRILIATDVASRGLDVKDLTYGNLISLQIVKKYFCKTVGVKLTFPIFLLHPLKLLLKAAQSYISRDSMIKTSEL